MTKLILVSRKSALALQQSNHVRDLLLQKVPRLNIEIVGISTRGDRNLDVDLSSSGGKGAFVSDLEKMLLTGDADLAIHSMKDVPVEYEDSLDVRSVGRREMVMDCLVSSQPMNSLPPDAKIGTASLRRRALLAHIHRKTNAQLVRGNVQTRLDKLDEGQYDALILAAAGLVRLSLESRINSYLDPLSFVPAAGQGVLAAQFRSDDERTRTSLKAIQDKEVEDCVTIERQVVEHLGGDCSMAAGVYCTKKESEFDLSCIVLDSEGKRSIRLRRRHKSAKHLIDQATTELIALGAEALIHGE